MTFLRPLATRLPRSLRRTTSTTTAASTHGRFLATQSGDDAAPPTALATLYLEDGSSFVGRSFGSHEAAVDGEVSFFSLSFLLVC